MNISEFIENNNNVSFETFLLICAPNYATKPSLDVSYYKSRLEESLNKQKYYENISEEEAQGQIDSEYADEQKHLREMLQERQSLKDKSEYLLNHMNEWVPLCNAHIEMKEQILFDLKSFIDLRCTLSYIIEKLNQPKLSFQAWKHYKISIYKDDANYYNKKVAEISALEQQYIEFLMLLELSIKHTNTNEQDKNSDNSQSGG